MATTGCCRLWLLPNGLALTTQAICMQLVEVVVCGCSHSCWQLYRTTSMCIWGVLPVAHQSCLLVMTCRFGLPHAHLPGSEKIFIQETAGLILFNIDNHCVQGLWTAVANKEDVVHWKAVTEYADVPADVYGSIISLNPFKQRYEAREALAVTKMLWKLRHPTRIAPVLQVLPQPVELPHAPTQVGSATIGHSAEGNVLQQALTTPNSKPVTPPGATTSTLVGSTSALTPPRQLPPHIAMLANRPGSGGGSGGGNKVTLMPGRVCTLCKAKPSGWLVMGCAHMGPCVNCLPKPDELTDRFYENPDGYPMCLFVNDGHVCRKPVKRLIRVVM